MHKQVSRNLEQMNLPRVFVLKLLLNFDIMDELTGYIFSFIKSRICHVAIIYCVFCKFAIGVDIDRLVDQCFSDKT